MSYEFKVSICITNYNQIDYIETAIESVINQNINYPYEILIGDDGSNDGSYELVREKYGNMANVRIFRQARDNSVKEHPSWRHSRLIVRLMEEVRGEYFSVLDGDDFYCDMDGLQRKIEILDAEENQDCILCNSNMVKLIDGEKILAVDRELPANKKNLKQVFFLRKEPYIHIATAVIRSSIIKHLQKKYVQDFSDTFLYFWAMNYGKRYYYPYVTFCYRIHKNSIITDSKQLVTSLRIVLMDDIIVCQWNKYRLARMKSRQDDYKFLYRHRYEFQGWDEYEMWYPVVKKYPGWALSFMEYGKINIIKKIFFNIVLFIELKLGFIINKIESIYDRICCS